MGSTSVVHIKAKPVIDIAVAVNSFSDFDGYIPALEARGVKYRPKVNIGNERFLLSVMKVIFLHIIYMWFPLQVVNG